MGVNVSTGILTPLSIVSITIGFVSFGFTIGTFLRVVWVNIETLQEAPHEVHGYLTTLRTELVEERMNIRLMRKQAKKYQHDGSGGSARNHHEVDFQAIALNEVTLKTMNDTVKSLIKKFRHLERPFLADGAGGIDEWKRHRAARRRGSSVSPYYEHSAYSPPPPRPPHGSAIEEKRARGRADPVRGRRNRAEEEADDEAFWAQRCTYAEYSLRLRFVWLWNKADLQALGSSLARVQVRRIARQVGGISIYLHNDCAGSTRTEQSLQRIEDRLNNIVGVRRVT